MLSPGLFHLPRHNTKTLARVECSPYLIGLVTSYLSKKYQLTVACKSIVRLNNDLMHLSVAPRQCSVPFFYLRPITLWAQTTEILHHLACSRGGRELWSLCTCSKCVLSCCSGLFCYCKYDHVCKLLMKANIWFFPCYYIPVYSLYLFGCSHHRVHLISSCVDKWTSSRTAIGYTRNYLLSRRDNHVS